MTTVAGLSWSAGRFSSASASESMGDRIGGPWERIGIGGTPGQWSRPGYNVACN